jgi:hypothetical protein
VTVGHETSHKPKFDVNVGKPHVMGGGVGTYGTGKGTEWVLVNSLR